MLNCDLDTSVPDWIIEYPETLAVFQKLGIDYSCGGRSLEFACHERGISAAVVLDRIVQEIGLRSLNSMSSTVAELASIQVGLPRTYGRDAAEEPMERRWTTGFYKEADGGPIRVNSENLDGDGQADRVNHGGPDKAILAYSSAHYAYWRERLELPDMPLGAFGENFTINGLTESNVCIGDTWQVGEVVTVQISQPRQPCWKLARRWRVKTLAAQVQQTGKTGWYFRVLHMGFVEAGMSLSLKDRPFPDWTVEQANRVMHHDKANLAAARELAAVPLLSVSWRSTLSRRITKQDHDTTERLIGENG